MIKHHPFADVIPMLKAPELAEMAVDIKRNGQAVKGVLYEGLLLDGRNRQAACKIAGVKFETEEYKGDKPREYVISLNLTRRHLPPAERAIVAAKLVALGGITEVKAAELLDVSRASVQRAKAKLPEKLVKPRRVEKTSWTHAELKADTDLQDIFTMIQVVYGNDDTRVLREGNLGIKLSEIKFLAKLPKEKMLEIQELIFAVGMAPTKAYAFVNRMADDDSTVTELIQWCIATKGKFWTGNFREGAFTITVKSNRAIQRP